MLELQFRVVLIELPADETVTEVHGLVNALLAKTVPVVLCGAETDQAAVRQSLSGSLASEGLLVTEMQLHVPNPQTHHRFRFNVLKVTLLHMLPLPFRV